MTIPRPPAATLRWLAPALLAAGLALCAGCTTLPAAPAPEGLQVEVTGSAPLAVADAASAPAAGAHIVADEAEPPITTVPLLPRTRLDPEQDARRVDLWQRVRAGFAMPDIDGPLVRKWEQWYAGQPDYVQRMTERGGRYLFHIVEEVQRRKMPTELALLPFIESAYNPQATSHARASGMWQFMPGTGRDFELQQNLFRDDRRDVLASTRAALDYLQRLATMFDGDWQLALAAYNWGQGNVMRAIERNQRAGQPADFDNLRMPQETREYLPKLQAVKNIVLHPDAFALTLPPLGNHPYFLSVAIDRDIDVALAARLSGLSLEAFQDLNPQMNKPVILAAGTPQVLLPYDNANQFVRELASHDGALATWTAWVAPRTLKPADAARLTGMDESRLRELNRIPPHMLVRVGSTLLVPRKPDSTADVSGHIADGASLSLAPEGHTRRVVLKAGKHGETVASVARRYRVSAALVAQWNEVAANGRFKPGQRIVVMVPARSAKTAVKRVNRVTPHKKAAPASTGKKTSPRHR